MKTVQVRYQGWGENWPLGTLADDGQQLLFEYSPQALDEGVSLSPRHLPLQKQAMGHFPSHQWRLPGLFADSLPDGWGMLLMDKLFRKQGIRPEQVSPLDRLSFIGHRGMGALTYEPDSQGDVLPDTVDLVALANETALVLQGADTETLQRLALLGGSPQGARPKVLVYYDPAMARISTAPMPAGSGWLVKFQALDEHKEVCAIEAFYAQLASACGLDMPTTRVFDLSPQQSALGIERFDLAQGGLVAPQGQGQATGIQVQAGVGLVKPTGPGKQHGIGIRERRRLVLVHQVEDANCRLADFTEAALRRVTGRRGGLLVRAFRPGALPGLDAGHAGGRGIGALPAHAGAERGRWLRRQGHRCGLPNVRQSMCVVVAVCQCWPGSPERHRHRPCR